MTEIIKEFRYSLILLLGEYPTWPPSRMEKLVSVNLEKGLLGVFATTQSSIKVIVTCLDGKSSQVETCQIKHGPQVSKFILGVIIDFPIIDIIINGYNVASTDLGKPIENFIEWHKPISDDISTKSIFINVDNEKYVNERIQNAAITSLKKGRLQAPDEKQYKDLFNAICQIKDQVSAIKRGEMHQDTALSARIRALICHGKNQYPLLQRCAGKLKLPLNIFGIPPMLPEFYDPKNDVNLNLDLDLFIDINITPEKTIETQVPIDIDFWLQMHSGCKHLVKYTNNEIIRSFADTEGAHYDNGIDPFVDSLRSISFNNEEKTMLHEYFLRVAECVIALGEFIIKNAQQVDAP
jgi:hypothetical protein